MSEYQPPNKNCIVSHILTHKIWVSFFMLCDIIKLLMGVYARKQATKKWFFSFY